jgi:hypothetical protein
MMLDQELTSFLLYCRASPNCDPLITGVLSHLLYTCNWLGFGAATITHSPPMRTPSPAASLDSSRNIP